MANRDNRRPETTDADLVLGGADSSLLDLVDNVLNKGVVLTGDLTIALAQVDLVYARLSLLLCAADRVLPNEDADFMKRHRRRYELRAALARRRAGGLAVDPRSPGTPERRSSRSPGTPERHSSRSNTRR